MTMRRKAKPLTHSVALDYAENLFATWPEFLPTRALYLDLEGGGSGNEQILSLYSPRLAGSDRFAMLWRGSSDLSMDTNSLTRALRKLAVNQNSLKWVVVFSGGQLAPTEKTRFESVFGEQWFPQANWVNLHYPMRKSRKVKKAVRDTRWAVRKKDKIRVPYSLENLEYQFGYVRQPELRAHENIYADRSPGLCKILEFEQAAFQAKSEMKGYEVIAEYCSWDVQTMFRIARWCGQNHS